MQYDATNPLIVQGDRTVLVEVDNPRYAEARDALAAIAELEKSPEHVHTYRITPLSLWNAASSGLTADAALASLEAFSKYDLPGNVVHDVRDYMSRYGRLKLARRDDLLVLESDGPLATARCHTLIVCFGTTAVRQWIEELLDKTTLTADQIGEYTGDVKEIRPVTVTTYQVLTYHPSRRRRAGADTGDEAAEDGRK